MESIYKATFDSKWTLFVVRTAQPCNGNQTSFRRCFPTVAESFQNCVRFTRVCCASFRNVLPLKLLNCSGNLPLLVMLTRHLRVTERIVPHWMTLSLYWNTPHANTRRHICTTPALHQAESSVFVLCFHWMDFIPWLCSHFSLCSLVVAWHSSCLWMKRSYKHTQEGLG